jgi:hypothetical protein
MAKPDDAWRRVYDLDHRERFDTSDIHMLATCCSELKRRVEELEALTRDQAKIIAGLMEASGRS